MKITKYALVASLITFFIGCVAVIGYFSLSQKQKVSEPLQVSVEVPKAEALPPIVEKAEQELIEDIKDSWIEDESKFKIQLLETGEGFHGDEVKAKSGEKWLGLFKEESEYVLRFTNLKISRVHDPVIDGYEEKYAKQKTGKNVSVTGNNQPIFLLKNASMLGEGEVKTLFHNDPQEGDSISFVSGFVKDFELNGVNYALRTKEGKNRKDEKKLYLVLEGNGISQVLHSTNNFEDGSYAGVLYWIGDLDRDGKPDLFTELYIHDNAVYKNLFLSSKAKKGELLKKVAAFIATGC